MEPELSGMFVLGMLFQVSQAEQKGVRNRGTTWSQAYPPDYKVGHGASDRLSVTTAMAYFGLLRVFLTQGLHKVYLCFSYLSVHIFPAGIFSTERPTVLQSSLDFLPAVVHCNEVMVYQVN